EAHAIWHHLDQSASQEAKAGRAMAGALVVWREKMPANMIMVANGGIESASGVPDHVDLGQSGRERLSVVEHARASPDVPQHHNTHLDSLRAGHPWMLDHSVTPTAILQ